MTSETLAVLDGKNLYLVTPPHNFTNIADASTPEEAVEVLHGAVRLLSKVKIPVLRIFLLDFRDLEIHDNFVEALKKEGFTNIESINILSLFFSANILNLPLKCAIGEPVFVYQADERNFPISVIKKVKNGWQIVKPDVGRITALAQHPSAKNVVVYGSTPETDMAKVQELFPGLKLHIANPYDDCKFRGTFIKNRAAKGNLNGYEVLPYYASNFILRFDNKCHQMKLTDRVPPFTATKVVDIGDATEIDVLADDHDPEYIQVIKTFNFKNAILRTVSVTVTVDKTLLPDVSLKTVATHKPPDDSTPVIYVVKCVKKTNTGYFLEAVFANRSSDEGYFRSLEELIKHMVNKCSISATAAVYFVYIDDNLKCQLQDFREACHQAGYSNVKFLANESLNISLLLDRAKVTVKADQIVAIVTLFTYCIFHRVRKLLKIIETGDTSDFDSKKLKVDTIIIENSPNNYTKTDLEHMRNKFAPCTVHVVTGMDQLKAPMPRYFWSLVNGTNFGGNVFNSFGDFDFIIDNESCTERVMTTFNDIPFTTTAEWKVVSPTLKVFKVQHKELDLLDTFDVEIGTTVRFTFVVESQCDITVKMDSVEKLDDDDAAKLNAEALKTPDDPPNDSQTAQGDAAGNIGADPLTLKPSETRLKSPPTTVLTFTSNNRVLIESDKTYDGDKEILAYVRLRTGLAPVVGKRAFDALMNFADSVFYDIPHLLAADFDPDRPNPKWGFRTSRDADGKITLTAKGNITTYPIVLFGLVINSTLLYIQEHQKPSIKSLGIRLPPGCVISETELKSVSEKISVDLILLV